MAHRPCKPDTDMKRLWQLLLPGVAVPACGVTQDAGTTGESAEPVSKPRHETPTDPRPQ